jgi:hypothetical protein
MENDFSELTQASVKFLKNAGAIVSIKIVTDLKNNLVAEIVDSQNRKAEILVGRKSKDRIKHRQLNNEDLEDAIILLYKDELGKRHLRFSISEYQTLENIFEIESSQAKKRNLIDVNEIISELKNCWK